MTNAAPTASTCAIPPRVLIDTRRRNMWAVEINVQGRFTGYTWRGWAIDSIDAKTRAMDEARQVWRGHTFAVLAVYQVGV